MTGKERILSALELREADRVPVWIHTVNEARIIMVTGGFSQTFENLREMSLLLMDMIDNPALVVPDNRN